MGEEAEAFPPPPPQSYVWGIRTTLTAYNEAKDSMGTDKRLFRLFRTIGTGVHILVGRHLGFGSC